jgi:hypothetical protein
MDKFLAEALGRTLTIAPDPRMTAARGAALIACEQMRSAKPACQGTSLRLATRP